MAKSIEQQNVEDISGGAVKKTNYEKILGQQPETPKDNSVQEAEIKETEQKLLQTYDETKIPNIQDIGKTNMDQNTVERVQKNRNSIPQEKKKEVAASIFKMLGYDPSKYGTQIANIANRATAPTKEVVDKIITSSNNIASLSEEKGMRGKVFKWFGFGEDKIA